MLQTKKTIKGNKRCRIVHKINILSPSPLTQLSGILYIPYFRFDRIQYMNNILWGGSTMTMYSNEMAAYIHNNHS